MFLKFESDGLDGNQTHMLIECQSFQVFRFLCEEPSYLRIDTLIGHVSAENAQVKLVDSPDQWQRVFVMNAQGETIDSYAAPSRSTGKARTAGALDPVAT